MFKYKIINHNLYTIDTYKKNYFLFAEMFINFFCLLGIFVFYCSLTIIDLKKSTNFKSIIQSFFAFLHNIYFEIVVSIYVLFRSITLIIIHIEIKNMYIYINALFVQQIILQKSIEEFANYLPCNKKIN